MTSSLTKIRNYVLLALVQLILIYPIVAQELKGQDAHRKIAGATRILLDEDGTTPRFVNFAATANWNMTLLNKLNVELFGNRAADSWLEIRSEEDDLGMTHTRFQQQYKALNVEGNVFIFHSKNGKISSANGHFTPNIDLSVVPALSSTQALEQAITGTALTVAQLQSPSAELIVFEIGGTYRLSYKCSVFNPQPLVNKWVFVDAQSGKVLKEISRVCEIDVVGTGHTQFSGVQPITTDGTPVSGYISKESGRGSGIETINSGTSLNYTDLDNDWNNVNPNMDEFAMDVHFGAEATYDFYFNNFGRDSYDNAGGYITSYVNDVTVGVNAYWSGGPDNTMHYGNGDADYFPVASLDVAGHELTHGVTEYAAGLIYDGESGALNESFSDIFGNTIRFLNAPSIATWYMGDQLLRPGGTGDAAFRNMANPNEFLNPDTYGGLYFNSGDIVHYDSGIQNFWYYLLVEGGTGTNDNGDNYSVAPLGLTDAMKIAYRNLAFYLTPNATFMDSRDGAEQAAIDLFGLCSPQQFEVIHAWYAVGVGSPNVANEVIATMTNPPVFSCTAPVTAQFTTNSNFESYFWDFGDGVTSILQNPSHTYTNNGNFTVTLTITNTAVCPGTDTEVITDAVVINPLNPIAGFTLLGPAIVDAATSFSDNTLYGPISWAWDFGDGGTSTLQNPSHTYTVPGLYDVQLIVTNCAGNDTIVTQIEVTEIIIFCETTSTTKPSGVIYDSGGMNGNYQDNENCTLLIQPCDATSITLTMEELSIEAGYDFLTVYDGTDNTTIPVAQFNGSNLQFPIISTGGSLFLEFSSDQSVTESGFKMSFSSVIGASPGAGSANFSASDPTPGAGQLITFTDLSLYTPTAWAWSFGDGGTSTLQNPTHTYTALGTFVVTLTVTYCGGVTDVKTVTYVINNIGLDELTADNANLFIAPNPFQDQFKIGANQPIKNLTVKMMDLSGREVVAIAENEVPLEGFTLNPGKLSNGQYILVASYETATGKLYFERHKVQVHH